MCNELKCAIQSTVDLIHINITRDVILDLESLTVLIRIMCMLSNETDNINLPMSNHDKLPKWKKQIRITLHFQSLKPLTSLLPFIYFFPPFQGF